MTKAELYYHNNQEVIELQWEDYISLGEWGSGKDFINPDTEKHFWEFVEEMMESR